MSRFRKLSQTLWHCLYHLIFVPKYRFKILEGKIASIVESCIRAFSEQKGVEIIELKVQIDHIHILAMIPPKISISDYVGIIKGRKAIRVFNKYKELKEQKYWGNHFWSRGYCVDTVGMDEEMIRKYTKYQDDKDKE
jgi:putative transposase